MKDPRADCKLKRLPNELQVEMRARLAEPGQTIAAVRDWLKDTHDIYVSLQTVSEWRSWYDIVAPVREARETLQAVREALPEALDRRAAMELLDAMLLKLARDGNLKAIVAARRFLSEKPEESAEVPVLSEAEKMQKLREHFGLK
jgi:hypothetical protein